MLPDKEVRLPSFCQLCQIGCVKDSTTNLCFWASGIGPEHQAHEAHQALGLHQAVQRITNVVHTIPFDSWIRTIGLSHLYLELRGKNVNY